jgi:hypothetical protein
MSLTKKNPSSGHKPGRRVSALRWKPGEPMIICFNFLQAGNTKHSPPVELLLKENVQVEK